MVMLLYKEGHPNRQGQIITSVLAPSGTGEVSGRQALSLPSCQPDSCLISSRMRCLSCRGRGLSLQICHGTQTPTGRRIEVPVSPRSKEVIYLPACMLLEYEEVANNKQCESIQGKHIFNFLNLMSYNKSKLIFY